MNQWITAWLAILVSTVWAVLMIVSILRPTYVPPAGVHGALMLVLGGVFGVRALGRSGDA